MEPMEKVRPGEPANLLLGSFTADEEIDGGSTPTTVDVVSASRFILLGRNVCVSTRSGSVKRVIGEAGLHDCFGGLRPTRRKIEHIRF